MSHKKESAEVYEQCGRSMNSINSVPPDLYDHQIEMLLQRHERKSPLYRIVTSDEKWIYVEKSEVEKTMPSTWRSRFFNTKAKSLRQEDHAFCLMGPDQYCEL
ncbi:hypothetical protein TNCV_1494811 [Trichonephila clavipes]|nr:hypothetical protein TNCV_1494811 [Trichonephila clavipes]